MTLVSNRNLIFKVHKKLVIVGVLFSNYTQ